MFYENINCKIRKVRVYYWSMFYEVYQRKVQKSEYFQNHASCLID